MQLINYDDLGQKVMAYHTVPSQAGTAGFEHKEMVSLSSIVSAKKRDGTGDPDTLVVTCPVAGCGTTVVAPLTGGEEAQRLHAKVRWSKGVQPTYVTAAVQSVVSDVQARGSLPRLDPNKG